MKLAFFVDQLFWQDDAGYSSDEAYTLFPISFRSAFDEVVLLGRLAPEPGRKAYALPAPAVTLCPLPYYPSVYEMWKQVWPLQRQNRAIVEANAQEWDVVIVCGPNPVGQQIARLCIRLGRPVVLIVRQNLVQQVRYANRGAKQFVSVGMAAWLEWRFRQLARGRVVFTVGEEMASAYRKVTEHTYHHFASLIDEARMEKLAETPPQPQPNRLLFVGRLSPEKGLSSLFAALADWRQRGKEYSLDVVGTGRSAHDLRAEVHALGLDDQVTFHGYIVYGETLLDFYRRARALIVPSLRGEGFPQVINEALAAGTPVIASRVGGIPAFVTDEETALLVTPGDVDGFVVAIEQICSDERLWQRLSQQGQQLMRHNTLETNRNRIMQVIRNEILHEHDKTASLGHRRLSGWESAGAAHCKRCDSGT